MELKNFSSQELQVELKRRESLEDKPKQIKNPNLIKLRSALSEYIDNICDGTYHKDSDIKEYIYIEAIKAFYEEGIFNWINTNTN